MSIIPRDGSSETAITWISALSLCLTNWEGAQIFSALLILAKIVHLLTASGIQVIE